MHGALHGPVSKTLNEGKFSQPPRFRGEIKDLFSGFLSL